MRTALLIAALCLSLAGPTMAADADTSARKPVDIPAQGLGPALQVLAKSRDFQVVYRSEMVSNLRTPGAVGELTANEALDRLLAGTGLTYRYLDAKTVTIVPVAPKRTSTANEEPAPQMRLVKADGTTVETASETREAEQAETNDVKGIPEMLVKGARTSNIDIQRTEDDVQPYVVFTADDIQHSMATSLDQFLLSRLPMNASRLTADVMTDSLPTAGNLSSIDLRGLGAAQTLILVNGRRVPGVGTATDLLQADINGIPMSSVARIEILPSTAGGIYGGGATGGVINIILKDDYKGIEIDARYDGTFRQDAQQRVLEASAGFSLEGGKTQVMLSGSHRDGIPLQLGDRDFAASSRAQLLENNPTVFNGTTLPLGGTTNIYSLNGSPLVLAATGQSLGSNRTYVPYGYAGPATDGGRALVANAGKYNMDWPTGAQGLGRGITAAPTVDSLRLNVRRSFTDRIDVFLDASRSTNDASYDYAGFATYASIPAQTPNNPFLQTIYVRFPANDYTHSTEIVTTSEVLGATAGLRVRLPHNWTIQGEYGRGHSEHAYLLDQTSIAFASFVTSGALSVLRDVAVYPQDYSTFWGSSNYSGFQPEPQGSNLRNLTLRLAGPTFRFPGGPVMMSALLEQRTDEVDGAIGGSVAVLGNLSTTYSYTPPRKQTTQGAYAEITAPLISAANALPLARALDLQMSYRRDRIGSRTVANNGQTNFPLPSPDAPLPDVQYFTNHVEADQYTLGLRYQPFESLALRVSNGVGVLPPSLSQLVPTIRMNANVAATFDPKRKDTPVGAIAEYRVAGNQDLLPEQSDSWSAGAIFTPVFLPGFRFSVDYTLIKKTNEISSITAQTILDLERTYPDRVRRDALSSTDIAAGYEAGRITYLNAGSTNIAHTKVEAYDLRADYQWTTRHGTFRADAIATYQTHFQKQLRPTTAVTEYMGFADGPLQLRGNGGVTWERGAWTLGWNMQYYDSFPVYNATSTATTRATNIRNQGFEFIPRQVYHDLSFKYRFDEAPLWGGIFGNSEVLVGVSNIFDANPPLVLYGALASASIIYPTPYSDPRLRRYSISLRKSFN